jgi:hypothetical protein
MVLGAGANLSDGNLSVAGTLNVSNELFDLGRATITSQGVLQADGLGSELYIYDMLTLAGGTLACGATDSLVIGDIGNQIGTIVLQSGVTMTGYGTIEGAPIADSGTIVAQGATLTLATAASGAGTITIDSGATLVAASGLSVASVAFAAGSEALALATPSAVTSTLSGFGAGDLIDLLHITATSLKFLGDTLTIKDGKTVIGALTLQGSYTTADFALMSDNNGGTEIAFAGAASMPPDMSPPPLVPNDLAPATLDNDVNPRSVLRDLGAASGWFFMGRDVADPPAGQWGLFQHVAF